MNSHSIWPTKMPEIPFSLILSFLWDEESTMMVTWEDETTCSALYKQHMAGFINMMMNTYPMSNRRYYLKVNAYSRKHRKLIEQCPICCLAVE